MKQYAIVMAKGETFARPVKYSERQGGGFFIDLDTGEIVDVEGAWIPFEFDSSDQAIQKFERSYTYVRKA